MFLQTPRRGLRAGSEDPKPTHRTQCPHATATPDAQVPSGRQRRGIGPEGYARQPHRTHRSHLGVSGVPRIIEMGYENKKGLFQTQGRTLSRRQKTAQKRKGEKTVSFYIYLWVASHAH